MNRITGLDFARVLMTLGIVFYHFACFSSAGLSFFNVYANGVWGGTYNAAFFALSGFCLYNKYGQAKYRIGDFYYKRWKTVVFPYALIFLFAYLNTVAATGRFFYLDIPKWYLAFSFLGLDGYVQWFHNTYFITGVWFIGAILIVYLLYPVLNWVFSKLGIVTVVILFVLYELLRIKHSSEIPIDINPIVCLTSFSVGMVLSKTKKYLFSKVTFIVSAVLSALLIFVPVFGSHNTKEMVLGWILFVLFSNIGHLIKADRINAVITALSRVSYLVILIHLPIIHKMLIGWDSPSISKASVILTGLTGILFLLAFAINEVLKGIYASKAFKWLDGKFAGASPKSK